MVDFNCRICGSDDLSLYYTQGMNNEFKYYKCNCCGLVNYDMKTGLDQTQYVELFLDPRDDTSKSSRSQDQSYQFLKKTVKDRGELIDIGCGNGRLLYQAKQDEWIVKGLDLSPDWACLIKEKLDIDVDVANFLEFDTENVHQYDVVVLRHVLEHLPDAILAMNKINALLKPGGYALLEFPNIEALDKRFKRYLARVGIHRKKYTADFMPGHCNEYSKKSFEYLVEKTDFRMVKWETYSLKPVSRFIYQHLHVGNKARALIRKSL
jgi:2-polyprenyl-3-methyl-5-hydroxy-6-metoxy-1,4-benzoquinol methylase